MIQVTKTRIGFDRRVRLAWLYASAGWAAQGLSEKEIRTRLDGLLEGHVAGESGSGGALSKTKTVLLRIWVKVPDQILPLRDAALVELERVAGVERISLHWGMCLAVYPFFFSVAEQIGRLARLQTQFTIQQVLRRICEEWGDTQRVRRSVQHVMQCTHEWGLLIRHKNRGHYSTTTARPLDNMRLEWWLIEAVLRGAKLQMASLDQLSSTPALFPFQVRPALGKIALNPRLDLIRQDLRENIVALRSPGSG